MSFVVSLSQLHLYSSSQSFTKHLQFTMDHMCTHRQCQGHRSCLGPEAIILIQAGSSLSLAVFPED